jgi:hypothetical protein
LVTADLNLTAILRGNFFFFIENNTLNKQTRLKMAKRQRNPTSISQLLLSKQKKKQSKRKNAIHSPPTTEKKTPTNPSKNPPPTNPSKNPPSSVTKVGLTASLSLNNELEPVVVQEDTNKNFHENGSQKLKY